MVNHIYKVHSNSVLLIPFASATVSGFFLSFTATAYPNPFILPKSASIPEQEITPIRDKIVR